MKRRSSPGPLSSFVVTVALCLAGVSGTQAQTWVQKGPAPANDGQPENITNSPTGGALEAVVAHPTDADILWVGSVNGGIFRTNNATDPSPTWTAQTDTQTTLSISALEMDPANSNILVAGIGRTSSYGSTGGILQGILRTTNGGTSWANPGSAGIGDKEIRGVAARGATILAAVAMPSSANCGDLGLFGSTDSGASFTQISGAAGTGMPCGDSLDLASDPTDPARFFAPATRGPGDRGLFVSSDSGANWAEVGAGSVMDTALTAVIPREVQVTVGNGGGASANIFVAVCEAGSLSGLFYSGDAGTSWASLDLPMTTEVVGSAAYGIHPGGQCGTHLSLVADPFDASVVYIGGDRQPANNEADSMQSPQFPNSIGASTYGGRLFKVDADLSGGSQATPITNCDGAPGPLPAGCAAQSTANDTAPHADSREMVFDADGDLIQTDDGGVYVHTDPGGTAGDWFSVVGNLGAIEQHDAAYDGVSDILISGNQDNGTTSQVTPASNVWDTVFGGDGGDVVVAQDLPLAGQSTRYFSSQNLGGLVRVFYDSSNTESGFAFPALTPLSGDPPPDPQFKTPLKVNEEDPTRLIVGAGNGLYESLDELDSVTRVSSFDIITSFRGGSPIAYGRPGNAELLYFGAVDGFIGSRVGPPGTGINYEFYASAAAEGITGVTIDPDSDVQAFATDTTNVYRTEDAGVSWTNVTGDLFTAPGNSAGAINFVEYINVGGDRLVVATDRGVYSATEASGFTTWTLHGTGLPNAVVFELDFNPADRVLVAGTMGRGTWTLTPEPCASTDIVFSGTTITIPETLEASSSITLGPALTINSTNVVFNAPTVRFVGDVVVGGTFEAGNTASCL